MNLLEEGLSIRSIHHVAYFSFEGVHVKDGNYVFTLLLGKCSEMLQRNCAEHSIVIIYSLVQCI